MYTSSPMGQDILLRDREQAAEELADQLKGYKQRDDVVVMAIPRGGVPIGSVVARALNAPLDIVLTKKIGHPMNPEYAIGSVTPEDSKLESHIDVNIDYIKEETGRLRQELAERKQKYMGDRARIDPSGKVVIIVDDGIATGSTMEASIHSMYQRGAEKVVVAVPVAPPDTIKRLAKKVDTMICLYQPRHFRAIGQFYRDFDQVSDEAVIAALKASRNKNDENP